MFADDLTLLAPTRSGMQKMFSVCESYCKEYCLSFNTKKTKSMIFGKCRNDSIPIPFTLNNDHIQFVSEWKYLGCLISCGQELSFSSKLDLSSFRCSANSIFSASRKPNEQVLMKLLYSFSVPILTYASEVKQYSSSEMRACHTALNDAIRRVFSFNRWESIRTLREHFGYEDLGMLFAKRRQNFFTKISTLMNPTVDYLYALR